VVAAATVLAASNVLLVAWRVQRRLWAERPGTRTAMGMATSTIVLLLLFVLGWALMAVSHAASEAAGALLVISGVPLAILLTVFVIYGFIESFVSLRTSSDGLETGASFILLLSCLVFVALAMALFSGVLGRLID
jgi:UDP-N-acetylmuramyl pentapeptide phosphotransferase/UDP-N-acetylglucosamine-1-phosphate transferase